MATSQPEPDTITCSTFTRLLKFYPEVQDAAYKAKVKNDKKIATALRDHDWRYEELPALLAERKSTTSPAFLTKDEMVRLTEWKIVHGQHRPFLPGMIKKNEPETVKEVTKSAFGIQATVSYGSKDLPQGLDKALREAAKLHGVGPATATLVCSISDPENVPFFEDELAEWLCPSIPKLKYSWAEYKMLFAEIMRLRARLGLEHKAVDIEKVGFVVGHLELLDEKQRELLAVPGGAESNTKQSKAESESSVASSKPAEDDISSDKPSNTSIKKSTTKRKVNAKEDTLEKLSETKPKAKRTKKG